MIWVHRHLRVSIAMLTITCRDMGEKNVYCAIYILQILPNRHVSSVLNFLNWFYQLRSYVTTVRTNLKNTSIKIKYFAHYCNLNKWNRFIICRTGSVYSRNNINTKYLWRLNYSVFLFLCCTFIFYFCFFFCLDV